MKAKRRRLWESRHFSDEDVDRIKKAEYGLQVWKYNWSLDRVVIFWIFFFAFFATGICPGDSNGGNLDNSSAGGYLFLIGLVTWGFSMCIGLFSAGWGEWQIKALLKQMKKDDARRLKPPSKIHSEEIH